METNITVNLCFGVKKMKSRKGFTLIELMIVILIVAILAAVLVPLMASRIEAAKWSEGKAGAGTVATALRAWLIEQNVDQAAYTVDLAGDLEFNDADLQGKYFSFDDYGAVVTLYTAATHDMTYIITVTGPGDPSGTVTLNAAGVLAGP